MNETQFLEQYDKDIPIVRAWGNYINSEIRNALLGKLENSPIKEVFLRIAPEPRIKDRESIIAKAFWRGKNYSDPYNEIKDKVGIRYVVLLTQHIKIIEEIICSTDNWNYSLDRDFVQEKIDFPLIFDYQSVHYILTSKDTITYDSIDIPTDTPCEIQIRTLLQHACSELTHDTIYKKDPTYNSIVYRSIAKSRALTESADDIFENVSAILAEESENMNKWLSELRNIYKEIREPDFEEKSNVFILNSIVTLLEGTNSADIKKFILEEKPVIKDIISSKVNELFIYRQPIVLLLYYLIHHQRENLKQSWPLPLSEIQPLFSDLGIALDPRN
ncbi:GTP pyrophosphokinase family protein [Chloroflexota bacterium]